MALTLQWMTVNGAPMLTNQNRQQVLSASATHSLTQTSVCSFTCGGIHRNQRNAAAYPLALAAPVGLTERRIHSGDRRSLTGRQRALVAIYPQLYAVAGRARPARRDARKPSRAKPTRTLTSHPGPRLLLLHTALECATIRCSLPLLRSDGWPRLARRSGHGTPGAAPHDRPTSLCCSVSGVSGDERTLP
jgi:hypothetical protein